MKAAWMLCLSLVVVNFSAGAAEELRSFDEHVRQAPAKSSPQTSQQKPADLTAGTFDQSIDHLGALTGQTFQQRYWVDSQYATSDDAPVLYHMCGESDASQAYFFTDSIVQWAQALGARMVFLEHRYYGTSQPFADLSTDHLQYLSLDNVMEDLASFQQWISQTNGWKGKWIAIGGSYSGTMAALYRQRHPELVVGALASSAPMISGVGESIGTSGDVDEYSSTDTSSDDSGRQWVYQACTGLGFWEADGPDPSSNLENPSSWLCQQLFAGTTMVNTTAYNRKYNTPFITDSPTAPSNILFTYGSDDVWTNIGLAQETNNNSKITIQMINGAGHHFDLNAPDPSDSQDVINARSQFLSLAKTWLGM